MRFLSHAIHGQTAPWKRPKGRAAAQFYCAFSGDWGAFPNKHFCEIDRREIEAKKQGVYHLALLATLLQHLHPTIIKALILLEC